MPAPSLLRRDEATRSPSESANVGDRVIEPLPSRGRLAKLLTSGGMACAHWAYDEFLRGDVAIKAHRPTNKAYLPSSDSADGFQRQKDEIGSLTTLSHYSRGGPMRHERCEYPGDLYESELCQAWSRASHSQPSEFSGGSPISRIKSHWIRSPAAVPT